MSMRSGLGVVAVSVAVGVAGCGGGSSNSTAGFKKQFAAVTQQAKQVSEAIGRTIQQASSQSDAKLAASFHGLAQRWQAVVTKFDGLAPPVRVASTFAAVKRSARAAEGDLRTISSAAAKHDVTAARNASGQLIRDVLAAKSNSQTVDSALGIK
jgi:hypothetical protein